MSQSNDAPIAEPRSTSLDVLRRVRAEYDEMPGLHLTDKQAARLWACDAESCRAVLAELEAAGFLIRTREGAFARA